MNCQFCNTKLVSDEWFATQQLFITFDCDVCKPHFISYREQYNLDTSKLLTTSISVDEFKIVNYLLTNKTKCLNRINLSTLFELNDTFEITANNIEDFKNKLKTYITFS